MPYVHSIRSLTVRNVSYRRLFSHIIVWWYWYGNISTISDITNRIWYWYHCALWISFLSDLFLCHTTSPTNTAVLIPTAALSLRSKTITYVGVYFKAMSAVLTICQLVGYTLNNQFAFIIIFDKKERNNSVWSPITCKQWLKCCCFSDFLEHKLWILFGLWLLLTGLLMFV